MSQGLDRRRLLAGGLLALTAAGAARAAAPKPPLVFDALGEIRTVYTPELVDQILASGTRAIAVTVTDPKVAAAEAYAQTNADLDLYDRYLDSMPRHYIRARRIADAERAAREGKLAVYYNLQNSTPVEGDAARLPALKARGVTSIQLTYNDTNLSGSGCYAPQDVGLTAHGRELIARLEAEGVLLDLSHAGMKTMAEAIAAARRPMIISHTACKDLRDHARNTTDANLRAVAAKGGVIGITQIRRFVTDLKRDNLGFYFDHIVHAVKVAGIEHVGIGSDRDHRVIADTEEELRILLKEEGPQLSAADWPMYLEGLNGPHRMTVVRDELRKRGFRPSELDKLLGANVRRIYAEVVG